MKRFLSLCFLLIAYQVNAQVVNFDMPIYAGRIAEKTLILPAADSAKTVTAVAYYSKLGNQLPPVAQPFVIRAGTSVIVRFERTDILPDVGWIQVFVSGQVRAAGRLIVGKVTGPPVTTPPPEATNPGSVVVVSQIKIYPVSGIASGYVINHNLQTKLVRVSAFWNDSGQYDPLWSGVIDTANTIHMWGPPRESFTGNIVIEPLK